MKLKGIYFLITVTVIIRDFRCLEQGPHREVEIGKKKESDFGLQESSQLVWDSVSTPLHSESPAAAFGT